MAHMKASNHEEARYQIRGICQLIEGVWSYYDIVGDGKTVVGTVSQRSAGGWVATLPIKDPETGRKIGIAYGRGLTPDEALQDADAKALQGVG